MLWVGGRTGGMMSPWRGGRSRVSPSTVRGPDAAQVGAGPPRERELRQVRFGDLRLLEGPSGVEAPFEVLLHVRPRPTSHPLHAGRFRPLEAMDSGGAGGPHHRGFRRLGGEGPGGLDGGGGRGRGLQTPAAQEHPADMAGSRQGEPGAPGEANPGGGPPA